MSIVELCWWCKRDGHKLETSKLKTRCQIERKKILNRIYMCMSYHPDIHIKYLLAKFICDNLCIKTWIDGRYSCSYYDTGYYLQNKYIESRKLILMARETPLSAIHIENMLKLSRLGVVILPPVTEFYTKPKTIDDIVNHGVGKCLDQFDIDHDLYPRWGTF